jgi:N-acetylmuramoyl-L-alanine amidase
VVEVSSINGVPFFYKRSNVENYGYIRKANTIKYIVVHYTGNAKDTAKGNANYFANNVVGNGAHYFVDNDCVYQSVDDNIIAWHCQSPGMALKCACRNANSIGVEMCCSGNYDVSEKTVANTIKLVKYLMNKYNIQSTNVIRHYDVCGKNCPAPFAKNGSRWNNFKSRLEEGEEKVVKQNIKINEPLKLLTKTGIHILRLGIYPNCLKLIITKKLN